MKTSQNKIDINNEVKNNPTRFDASYYAELLVAPWFEDNDPRLFEFGDMAVKAYKCCPANGFTEKATGWLADFQQDIDGHTQAHTERVSTEVLAMQLAELYRLKADEDTPREDISEGMTVYPDDCLSEWHGRAAKVVRKFKADWGTWCLDLEFADGSRYTYAEKYVLTRQPWSVVGATCKHRWTDTDVVLTITAAGQYYGIKAESEDGKVKWTGLARDFTPCTPDGRELLPEPPAEVTIDEPTLQEPSEIKAEGDKAEPSSWRTDFTADDFQKLTSRYEIADEDRDIIGRRFRSTVGLGELQVFVSDYAGNERHALYYIWDEWMQEVRANVRPLDFLRQMLTEGNKWEPVAA